MRTRAQKRPEILDLDALEPKRPQVKFPGGKFYDLAVFADLGLLDMKMIKMLAKDIEGMVNREEELTGEEVEKLKDALDTIALMLVPDAPVAELQALTDMQKIALLQHFPISARGTS